MTNEYKNTIEELRKFAIKASRLERLEEERVNQEIRLAELSEEIKEAKVEIDKMADRSFMNIYMRLTNQLDAHYKIEEQYYLDVSLEYNDVAESLVLLKAEIQLLENDDLEFQSFKKGLKKKMNKFRNTVQDTRVESYIGVTKELETCFQLKTELVEAVTLGDDMIEGLIHGVEFIKEASFEWKAGNFSSRDHENSKLERSRFSSFKEAEFKKYQSIILPLRHNFIKFIGEVNDVYIIILRRKKLPMKVINKFTNNYLRSLATDMRKAKNFGSSIRFLNQYKDRVEVLTNLMKDDLMVVDQDIIKLEDKEAEIIASLVR